MVGLAGGQISKSSDHTECKKCTKILCEDDDMQGLLGNVRVVGNFDFKLWVNQGFQS